MSMRLSSPLPERTESIVTKTIGCAITVHRCLGPGLLEGLYEDAMTIELEFAGLRFDRQREIILKYRDRPLRSQRIDLIVEDAVIVEIKSIDALHPLHRAQLISYLRSADMRIGLLINFNVEVLKGNIKRIVR